MLGAGKGMPALKNILDHVVLALFVLLVGVIIVPILAEWTVAAAFLTLIDRRFGINALILDDEALNTVLLGAPYETVSQRTAWCRKDGGKPWGWLARIACTLLTMAGRLVGSTQDHCTWAITPGTPSGYRIWRWSGEPLEIVLYELKKSAGKGDVDA